MKATLNQIETFFWIARLQSFQAAAEELNLSQPTISLRVRDLERAVGSKLFERAGRRLRLTQFGFDLLPEAERIVNLATQFTGRGAGGDQLRGKLRLGGSDSFGMICMPGLLAELSMSHPDLSVAMTIDNSLVLRQRLNRRELDVAFLAEPEVESHVRIELIGSMTHVWVAGPNIRIPERIVTPAVLARHHIVTNPDGSMLMRIVKSWFGTAGLRPQRMSTCNSLSVIVRLAAAGEAVSFLPSAIVAQEIASKQLRVLNAVPKIPEPRLFAAYQLDKESNSMRSVINVARRISGLTELVKIPQPPARRVRKSDTGTKAGPDGGRGPVAAG
jgi:DNA-binding transcriptional LysR family regulator